MSELVLCTGALYHSNNAVQIASAASSSVAFPALATEPPTPGSSSFVSPVRPPHLPFRRISLPAVPQALPKRNSFTSIASEESQFEDDVFLSPHSRHAARPAILRNTKSRPKSMNPVPKLKASRTAFDLEKLQDQSRRDERRRKIIQELHDTERAYVNGLDLIYMLFLTPLIASLDDRQPLLDRKALTAIFSNFIDIWNLHRSFFSSLTRALKADSTSQHGSSPPVTPISNILLSHFPYLSLYSPFVTSFGDILEALHNQLGENRPFANFVKRQEGDKRCGNLKLQDWLLTVVQRCPRYLLLLKDLIRYTSHEDPEYQTLSAVHTLLSKITMSLNSSLHTHSQTLAMLALQRATSNLPFSLITPGRTLLRRSAVTLVERLTQSRELFLFSDCLIWLARVDRDWLFGAPKTPERGKRAASSEGSPQSTRAVDRKTSHTDDRDAHGAEMDQAMLSDPDDRYVFEGKLDLIDVEVVVPRSKDSNASRTFEILGPERSFSVLTGSESSRDQWVSDIRGAKASLLMSLNVMHPNTTLNSSSATDHIRRALQALPHHPDEFVTDDRQHRGTVEHYVPAVWIPDSKSSQCMRCGMAFNWRRRRHHCRLCGRCVCASCSGSTFFINDAARQKSKPARACDACYETVFPILSPSQSENTISPDLTGTISGNPMWRTIRPPAISTRPSSALLSWHTLQVQADEHGDVLASINDKHEFHSHSSVPISDAAEVILGNDATPTKKPSSKRYSMPAVALSTVPVQAGTSASKRLSLVSHQALSSDVPPHKGAGGLVNDQHRGLAAERLHTLLSGPRSDPEV